MVLLLSLERGRRSLGLAEFRLASWLLLFAAAGYGLASITLLRERTGPQALVDQALAGEALAIVAGGLTVMVAGYQLGRRRKTATDLWPDSFRSVHCVTASDLDRGWVYSLCMPSVFSPPT